MVNSMKVEKEAYYKTYDIARAHNYKISYGHFPSPGKLHDRVFRYNEHVLMNCIRVRNEIDNIVDSTLCW